MHVCWQALLDGATRCIQQGCVLCVNAGSHGNTTSAELLRPHQHDCCSLFLYFSLSHTHAPVVKNAMVEVPGAGPPPVSPGAEAAVCDFCGQVGIELVAGHAIHKRQQIEEAVVGVGHLHITKV